jgi:hypothetical protein
MTQPTHQLNHAENSSDYPSWRDWLALLMCMITRKGDRSSKTMSLLTWKTSLAKRPNYTFGLSRSVQLLVSVLSGLSVAQPRVDGALFLSRCRGGRSIF